METVGTSAAVTTSCLPDDSIVAFVTGQIPAADHRAAADHIDRCELCRRLVSEAAAAEYDAPGEPGSDGGDGGVRPGEQLDRFVLIRRLGHGTMGEVWAARDQELDREVALKLLRLRGEVLGTEATARLRREAQAMARLNHRNVVTIYELGASRGRVFCAMELVAGTTLRRWLETPRSWREVVGVATAAGRGIAAAHGVGLIHRDIKPENVLIAADGRALISDFGLAKLADLGLETYGLEGGAPPAARNLVVRGGLAHDAAADGVDVAPEMTDAAGAMTATRPASAMAATGAMTATGAMVGTPVYMAPEQLAGTPADARGDQFSYCVTFYEALFGSRPFAGDSVEALAQAMQRGLPRRRRHRGVPDGVVRCLARGLAADPTARWPSMTALVDAIERAARRPAQRRRAALVAGLATAALSALLVVASVEDPVAAARSTAAQRIARAWNAPRKAILQARFLASGTPVAGERAATTIQLLDAYRDRWLAARVDAWAALPRRGDPSTEDSGRRLACLDQLGDAMERLVGLFLFADAGDVQDAPQNVYRLDPIASCANLERLAARPAAPALPIAILTEWPLRELETLQRAGRQAEANRRAPELIAPAMRFGTPALRARARYDLGAVQSLGGHFTEAEATLRLAVQEAARARDHELVADGWLRLLNVTGFGLQRYDAAAAIEPAARAAVAQAGDDPRQLAELAKTLGLIATTHGEAEVARVHFTEARSLHVATRGAQDPLVGTDEANIGAALLDLGRADEAAPHFERAIAILRAAYGEHHPAIAGAEHNLATIAADRKDWAAGERHARAAIAINLIVLGPDHPGVAANRLHLVRILLEQRRLAEARAEIARARAVFERSLPANHPSRLTFDLYLAQVDDAEGNTGRAIATTRRVVAAIQRADVPEPQRVWATLQLATLVSHRSPREALPIFEQALQGYLVPDAQRKRGDAELLRAFCEAALRAGQPEAALRWFDRAPAALRAELADVRQQLERAAHR